MGRVKHDDLVAGVTGTEVRGKNCASTSPIKASGAGRSWTSPSQKANVKFAANKLATIKHEIAINTFQLRLPFSKQRNGGKVGPVRKRHQLGVPAPSSGNCWSQLSSRPPEDLPLRVQVLSCYSRP